MVHLERHDGKAILVHANVHDTGIRLERTEADDDDLHMHGAEPVLRALPETVQVLLELPDERNSCFVVGFVVGCHLDEHVPFDIDVEGFPSAGTVCAPRSPAPPRLRASCRYSGACTREQSCHRSRRQGSAKLLARRVDPCRYCPP